MALEPVTEDDLLMTKLYVVGSLSTICKIPGLPEVNGEDKSGGYIRNALWESVLLHTRLLADFLVKQPPRDVTAKDFFDVCGAAQPTHFQRTAEASRLGGQWFDLASKEVVHYTLHRNPLRDGRGLSSIESSVTDPWIRRMVLDAVQVYADFVSCLDMVKSPEVDDFKEPLDPARKDLETWNRISVFRNWGS